MDGWDSITAQIDAIGRFQDDWDGAGSPAPDPGAVVGEVAAVAMS